jgi:thiol-disulfide isomerase/thioredoxin
LVTHFIGDSPNFYTIKSTLQMTLKKFMNALCYILLIHSVNVYSQQNNLNGGLRPEVGRSMPDFRLDNIKHYKTTKASLVDFKGKWLFLDFWFPGCVTCVKSFPEINLLQQEFRDQVQFMMVGLNGFEFKGIEKIYEKYRAKYNLKLAVAYDSILSEKWNIHSMPYIIIIDPNGKVNAITNGQNMSVENIRDLISGRTVKFALGDNRPEYDVRKFPGTPDNTLVYRSILTKWKGERGMESNLAHHVTGPPEYRKVGFFLVAAPLSQLYAKAHIGENNHNVKYVDSALMYPFPILEVKDKKLFEYDSSYGNYEGIYNYNLALPVAKSQDIEYVKKIFQQELKNVFGFDVSFERRKFKVCKIIVKPGGMEKLRTKGGEKVMDLSPIHMKLINVPIETFCQLVIYKLQGPKRLFIDENETGFAGNIDVTLDTIFTDYTETQSALRKVGIDLIEEERELKVMVIRDPLK